MRGASTVSAATIVLAVACGAAVRTPALRAQEPPYLRDRGEGVATSMFGTYVRRGELLVYPFVEFYADRNLEYKPSELGYGVDVDYRGRYRATEGLLFLSYGITDDLAVEFEAAVITAELRKSPGDTSAMSATVEASGLGDVEGQLRWRFRRETERRPEWFGYFETVFPTAGSNSLIGTSDWEWKLGLGVAKGFDWGTITFRLSAEYSRAEGKFEAGEYAVEYLRRLSRAFRVVALVEGVQLDEVALITEVQWHLHPRVFLKVNNGWGLTTNATDFAPEIGVMFRF